MFETELFSDFRLMTSDREVLAAHKVVLSARSPVFYAMLTSKMQEAAEGFANVPDFDAKVMKEVLRFIYYAEVENLSEISHDLVYAAEKYQLDELKRMCLVDIKLNLKVSNLIESILIAEHVNAADLYVKCVDLMVG